MDTEDNQIKYLESFVDIKKINQLIDKLNELKDDQLSISKAEVILQNFSTILDEYQEQPHLIDPFLKDLVDKIFLIIKEPSNFNSLAFHTAFQYLYCLTKVRGFKIIINYLPHEVEDFVPVIRMINSQSKVETDNWQTKYILLIWLSVLVLLPFHLERFDAIKGDNSLMEQIYDIIIDNLCKPAKYSDSAAFLAAKFLTRPETNKIYLNRFIDWSIEKIDQNLNSPLLALSYIFKLGKRNDVNIFGNKLSTKFLNNNNILKENDFKLKLIVKLMQRIALSYLKSKIAAWRYQRGCRFLINNLNNEATDTNQNGFKTENLDNTKTNNMENDDEDFIDLDEDKLEEISNIINFLLSTLKHRNIEVRWSASKGLGRITERLTKDLAEDIVNSLTELFNYYEEEQTWHGACLSIAELARRGLILPEKLSELVPLVSKALVYEELRGNFTSGKIVRDAACYICWAFARAFEPKIIRPFVDSIATTLIIVAIFDKEVIIRRAAAAAFQENVGRQGTFPNGIDIVTTVDHFSVQLITRSYLEISPKIANYDIYKLPLIDHLVNHKIKHWESNIRILSSQALHNITMVVEPSIIIEHAIPKLLNLTLSLSYKDRHGSILALAEIVHALSKKQVKLDQEFIDHIESIFLNLISKEKLTGLSGEFMQHSLNVLIEKCSLAELKFNQEEKLIELWIDLIKKSLSCSDLNIRKYAINAFNPFCNSYLKQNRSKQDELLAYLIIQVKSGTEDSKIGALSALSTLPDSMLEPDTPSILINTILNLLNLGSLSNKNLALVRSKAIKCIKSFLINLDKMKLFGLGDSIEEFLNFCMKDGVNDYTMYSLKDIGYYLRNESVSALSELMIYFIDENLHKSLVERNLLNILSSILPQCVSPNDNLRTKSSNYFYEIIKRCPFEIDEIIKTKKIFNDVKDEYSLRDYSTNFKIFVQLFEIERFRIDLWKGYVLTTGGFEFSSVTHSRDALINYLNKACSLDKELFENIQTSLYKLFVDNSSNNRYPITIIKTYECLITSGAMDSLSTEFLIGILNTTWDQIKKSDDIKKICAGSILICSLLRFKELSDKCLSKLMILLCSRFPNVRSKTADTLYNNLLIFGDLICEDKNLEEVLRLLSEIVWSSSDVPTLKEARKKICSNLSIPEPIRK